MTLSKSLEFNNVKYTFETGRMAFRADSAIFARAGDTTLLVAITVDKSKIDSDFFPLTVEFVEKMYSIGKISSNKFMKRERFPSDAAILKARGIDRAIRPYFPANFKLPVQIVVTLFSYDQINDPYLLAINAVSLALCNSSIPFDGPIAAVRVAQHDGLLISNPSAELIKTSDLDLLVAGKGDEVSMVELESKQISEDLAQQAFKVAVQEFKPFIDLQNEFVSENQNKKVKNQSLYNPDFKELLSRLSITEDELISQLTELLYTNNDEVYQEKIGEIRKSLTDKNGTIENKLTAWEIEEIIYKYSKKIMRKGVLVDKKRLSGRGMSEIRELMIETNVLPVVHGSALFSRGITQALSVVTLGSLSDVEVSESYLGEEHRYYIHHYNGASFSLGEAGRYSYNPGRREIGHGELAEKALKAVLPDIASFPYTIRVVSEVLSQSGSSSMASTSGSTLALMDAGVPIKAPVAGIAIGLVTADDFNGKSGDYQLVVDMADKEDFFGDMDFKVTGTRLGITAIQMDNKLGGIPLKILNEALDLAFNSRLTVLDKMATVISTPNKELKDTAPQVRQLQINPEKIGELIGPGGKIIKSITEKSGAKIDISDSGLVTISSSDKASLDMAFKMVDMQVGELEIGKVYDAEIDGLKDYGIFVKVGENHSGLVHISEIHDQPVSEADKVSYSIGDKVKVLLYDKDQMGRLQFSIKRVKEMK